MVLFSIVIPIYNAEKYLHECLTSVVKQPFDDYEVILVDDGSTDASPQICDTFAQTYENLTVIHKKNEGSVRARLSGMLRATGAYILSVDSDDLMAEGFLPNLAKIVEDCSPDVIAYGYQEISPEGERGAVCLNAAAEGYYTGEKLAEFKEHLVYDTRQSRHNMGALFYSAWSKAIRRELAVSFQQIVPPGIKNGEDLAAVLPAVCHAGSIYVLGKVGYYYRILATSMVHSFRESELEGLKKVIAHVKENAQGVPRNNLCGYAYWMTMAQAAYASRSYSKYAQFKAYVARHMDETLWAEIDAFRHPRLNLYSKLRCFLIRKRHWLAFWLLCRYIG